MGQANELPADKFHELVLDSAKIPATEKVHPVYLTQFC